MRTRRSIRRAKFRTGGITRFARTTRFSPEEAKRRRAFFAECNAAYAEMRADPERWAVELAERAELEGTLMDGLEDEY